MGNAALIAEKANLQAQKKRVKSPPKRDTWSFGSLRRRLPCACQEANTWVCEADASHRNPRTPYSQQCAWCGLRRPLNVENPTGLWNEIKRIELEITNLKAENAKLTTEIAELKKNLKSKVSPDSPDSSIHECYRRRLSQTVFPPLSEIQACLSKLS